MFDYTKQPSENEEKRFYTQKSLLILFSNYQNEVE
jgi:hypothetical protein